jgi:hypothetical protein
MAPNGWRCGVKKHFVKEFDSDRLLWYLGATRISGLCFENTVREFLPMWTLIYRPCFTSILLGTITLLLASGCGTRSNQVVGESNGWTVEDYKKAIAEQDDAPVASEP